MKHQKCLNPFCIFYYTWFEQINYKKDAQQRGNLIKIRGQTLIFYATRKEITMKAVKWK